MRRRSLYILMLLWLGLAAPGWSANQVLWVERTPALFADAAQSPVGGETKVLLTWAGLPPSNGQVSAVWDRGTGALASDIIYRCSLQLTGSLDTTESLELWLATSDGTRIDGPVTANSRIDAATTPALRALTNSLKLAGQLVVNKTTGDTAMNYSGMVHDVTARYLYLVAWNMTSYTVRNVTTATHCRLIPVAPEIQ